MPFGTIWFPNPMHEILFYMQEREEEEVGRGGNGGRKEGGEGDVDFASLHEPVWWETPRAPLRKTPSVLRLPRASTSTSPPSPAYPMARGRPSLSFHIRALSLTASTIA